MWSPNPPLQEFHNLPSELDAIEEQIHEYQAQADMCMGTDENVSMHGYQYMVIHLQKFV